MLDGAVAIFLLVLAVALFGMAQFGTRPTSRWRMVLLRAGAGLTVRKLWYVTLVLLLITASVSIYFVHGVTKQYGALPLDQPPVSPEQGSGTLGNQLDRDPFDSIYRALTLLSFGADWTLPPSSADPVAPPPTLEWPIQVLRFLIPAWIVLAGGWLLAFESVGSWFQRMLMPRRRHTVVFGLGEAGTTFVSAWIRPGDASFRGEKPGADATKTTGRKDPWEPWRAWKRRLDQFTRQGPVIAVERDLDAPGVAVCRAHGIPVVIGDPMGVDGKAVLAKAGIQHAKTVVGLLPDDVPNIELALRVQAYCQEKHRDTENPLVFIAQVNDVNLSRRLNYYEKITHLTNTDLRFQNIYRLMAEQLVLGYPPDFHADVFGRDTPHIAIYGFGQLGQQVLTQCLRLCHTGKDAPTDITIFDRDRERVQTLLETEYPGLWDSNRPAAFNIRVIKADLSVPAPTDNLFFSIRIRPVTQHVVCFPDEKFALSFSLALRDALMEVPGLNAPIFVRTRREHGLAALLDSNCGVPEIPDGLFPFGMLERVIRPEILNNTYLEALAEALHQVSYVPFHGSGDWAGRDWKHLDDHSRRSNRLSALHLDTKLRTVGLRRAPAQQVLPPPDEWRDNPEICLAELEHRRWVGAHVADGWRYGPTRSNMLRIHDAMCAYKDLKGTDFEDNDRRNIDLLPGILAGDAEGCREAVRALLAAGNKDEGEADRFETQALEHLSEHPQGLFPIRRIGIVCTEPSGDESPPPMDTDAFGEALDGALRDAGMGGLSDLRKDCAVTIMSPLLHPLEREAARWLLEEPFAPTADEASMDPPEEIGGPPRHQILALLPLPFDVLAGEQSVWGPPEQTTGCRPTEQAFQTLIGNPRVHYVEMPLKHPGSVLSAKEGLCSQAHQDQYTATWRYMARRCDLVVVLPGEGTCRPLTVFGRAEESAKAAVVEMHTDGTLVRVPPV
jgi:voltage-gated potassium channel Kch